MDASLKFTDEQGEVNFSDLVGGDFVHVVPLFQRQYKWTQKQLKQLFLDINELIDGDIESCFLGVIVNVAHGQAAGRPQPQDIIDGQQRIATLYLVLMGAVEKAARNGQFEWAADVISTYLILRPFANNPANTKFVPSTQDRSQFKRIWDEILAIPGLATQQIIALNRPIPPNPSGPQDGYMLKQYKRIKSEMNKIWNVGGFESLQNFVNILVLKVGMLNITLRNPLTGPRVFSRLNALPETVTVGDLVRNEVFSKLTFEPERASILFREHWEPFASHFNEIDKGLDKFLFPYALIQDPNTTQADIFAKLRSHWGELDGPEEMISDMEQYRPSFISLEMGRRSTDIPDSIFLRLNRINRVGKPSSIFPFIMRLVTEFNAHSLSEQVVCDILDIIESFFSVEQYVALNQQVFMPFLKVCGMN